MQREPSITWRNISRSEAVEEIIRKRIEAVEKFCPDAVGLRITLNAPQKLRHAARGFDVRLHLEVPGPDLDVARTIRHGHAADDIIRAVNAAFTALEKRIKETRRIMGGQEVKHHPVILMARSSNLNRSWAMVSCAPMTDERSISRKTAL